MMQENAEESLQAQTVRLLKKRHLTVATGESCTGGLVAAALIDVPGSSAVIHESHVTYSNDVKVKCLGVRQETLDRYTEVSAECAAEMAQGAAKTAQADIGISTTGIAGPDGGSEEKPVGLVYIGCDYKGRTSVTECHFAGGRAQVRQAAVHKALRMICEILMQDD